MCAKEIENDRAGLRIRPPGATDNLQCWRYRGSRRLALLFELVLEVGDLTTFRLSSSSNSSKRFVFFLLFSFSFSFSFSSFFVFFFCVTHSFHFRFCPFSHSAVAETAEKEVCRICCAARASRSLRSICLEKSASRAGASSCRAGLDPSLMPEKMHFQIF